MENPKIEQARHLYFAQAKTQKEIAQLLDVSEKTIYNWIKRHSWDQLRQAARQAPALITENLCSQIVELQNSIDRREPGDRFPTIEESLVLQRLITMLDKMKKFPGLSTSMQVMETFRTWMRPRDKSFTRDFSLYAGLFLQGCAQNNYHPHQLEFGIDNINPLDPFYDEEPLEPEPENRPADPSQNIGDQDGCNIDTAFPTPVKTGNLPATPTAKTDANPQSEKGNSDVGEIDEHRIDDSSLRASCTVKTGNLPATRDRSDDFPWRKWNTIRSGCSRYS